MATTSPALDFALLYVSNMDESLAYFTEKLGFTYIAEESDPGFSQLKSNGGGIDFALLLATPETLPAGQAELYFKTDDLESLRETWTAKGIEATSIAHRPFGSIFSVTSPDGQSLTMLKN
ncbi:MAG: VOC family protein [Ktedonobacteraceae bacterium]